MPRYIDADVLKWRYIPLTIQPEEFVTKSDVENAPTADVRENIHAHWEDWSFLGWDMATHWRRRCSNCLCDREDDNEEKDTPFCPVCGAVMDEEKEDV